MTTKKQKQTANSNGNGNGKSEMRGSLHCGGKKAPPPVEMTEILGGLRGWDADGLGSAGFDGAAGDGLGGFVQADFDGGEVVVAATEGEAGRREGGVGGLEEADDLGGGHGDLLRELGEGGGDGDGVEGGAGEGEEGVGGEVGAGAVGLPLVAEEAGIGVDVAVLRWV